jgi:hypothetical protein
MPRIAVAMCTFYGEKHHLVNSLRSLVPLDPVVVSIADTSRTDEVTIKEFHDWLYDRAGEYGLRMAVTHKPWDGWYSRAKNRALDVAATCSDWTVLIDSDEMLSLQFANDVHEYLVGVPPHILVVRFRKLELLNDETCLSRNLWPKWYRRNMGAHPRMNRSGVGRYHGRVHERYDYPGRKTIPFHSPEHPKADWNGSYGHCLLHLWAYRDNMMRRRMGRGLDISKMPLDMNPQEAWRVAKDLWLAGRDYHPTPVPEDVSWVPIIWRDEPDKWVLQQVGSKWAYKLYYGQGGR